MFNALFDDKGCPRKRIRDAKDFPVLDRTRGQFLFHTKVRAEPIMSEGIFQIGAYILNPPPLNAITSYGVIVILSSSDDASSREDSDSEISEISSVSHALAELERKRRLQFVETSGAGISYTDAEGEPVTKKRRTHHPKKQKVALFNA